MSRLAVVAVLLTGCVGASPPVDDLLAAALARMETSPVTDQTHLGAPIVVLDEVVQSDRKITAELLPSTDRWRIASLDVLQREADATGRPVYYARLSVVSSGRKTKLLIAVFV